MMNTVPTQSSQNVFERQQQSANGQQPLRGVRQDKPHPSRERIASTQPGSVTNDMRSHKMNSNTIRSENRPIPKRRTAQLIVWVHPLVKAEIQRTAKREGLSASKVGAALLEKAIQQDIRTQQETLFYPVIRQVIREELRTFSNRIVFFLMRIAFASEQSRILITNILDRILRREGAPEHTLSTLVDQSNTLARRNIIKKTEQMKALLTEWEASFPEVREGDTSSSNG